MTQQNLLSFINKVRKDIVALGADLAPVEGVIFRRRVSPIGLCLYGDKKKIGCILEFSKKLLELDEEAIHETVAHELLHTIKGSIGHDKKFMKYAKMLNEKYGLDIGEYMSPHIVQEGIKHHLYNYVVTCDDCGESIGYVRKAIVVKELLETGEAPDYCCPFCGRRHLSIDLVSSRLNKNEMTK